MPALGRFPLNKIRPLDVQKFLGKMTDKRLSRSRIRQARRLVAIGLVLFLGGCSSGDTDSSQPVATNEQSSETPAEPSPSASEDPQTQLPKIDNGSYVTTVTKKEARKAGLRGGGIAENLGLFRLTLTNGKFVLRQRPPKPVANPLIKGRYFGTKDEITFFVDSPDIYRGDQPHLAFDLANGILRMRFISLTPPNPFYEPGYRAIFSSGSFKQVGA